VSAIAGPIIYYVIQHTGSFFVVLLMSVLFYAICLSPQSLPGGWIAGLNARGRHINFGFTRAFGSLSFALISLVIGVVVKRYTMSSLPVLLAIFGFFMAFAAFLLPKPEKPESVKKEKSESFGVTMKSLLSIRPYVIMLVATALFNIPGGAYYTYFSIYFTGIGGTESALGVAMFVLAVVEVPVMMLYSKIERRIPAEYLVMVSALGYGLKNFCLGFAQNTTAAIACLALQVFGLALAIPASQSMIVSLTPAKYSSTAQAIYFSVQSIGSIVSNILCSWLVTVTNLHGVFRITSYFAFAGAALLLFTVCLPEHRRRNA
jgi:PPP family 3-phenylpropionic acid transporter